MTSIEIRAVEPEVQLINYTRDPIKTLWAAFRTCYSESTPQELWGLGRTNEEMLEFVQRRAKTEHSSPLEHVSFTFAISGVSRVFTHQFVRHRVGVSISQQSGRYTDPIKTGVFEYVRPDTEYDWERDNFSDAIRTAVDHYVDIASEKTMTLEDARMMLPNCQATNMFVTINLAALLHMADIRMCLATQLEFRNIVGLMRRGIMKVSPDISRMIGPKCMEYRRGACDEDLSTYKACSLSEVRPHKLGVGE